MSELIVVLSLHACVSIALEQGLPLARLVVTRNPRYIYVVVWIEGYGSKHHHQQQQQQSQHNDDNNDSLPSPSRVATNSTPWRLVVYWPALLCA